MAGSTNFLQWNPTQANQDTDSAFAADAQRVGGAPNGVPFPSQTGNKLFYQMSTGIAALMQAMATKGYVVNDTNIATLAATLGAIRTTADAKAPAQVLTGLSGPVTLNAATFGSFELHLTGTIAITIAGAVFGQTIPIVIFQPAGGGAGITITGAVGEVWYDASPNANSTMMLQVVSDNSFRAIAPAMSGSGLNGIPIGQSSPANGKFVAMVAASAAVNTLSVSGTTTLGGNLVSSAAIQAIAFWASPGAVNAGYGQAGDTSTGFFFPATGQARIACEGTTVILCTTTALTIALNATFNGTVSMNQGGAIGGNWSGSPNFTGSPTSTTPAATDSSSRIATTGWFAAAFAAFGFAGLIASPGYIKLPSFLGGIIFQWGTTGNLGGGSVTINFPISFPVQLFGIQGTALTGGNADFIYITAVSTTQATIHDDGGGADAMWFAYGH